MLTFTYSRAQSAAQESYLEVDGVIKTTSRLRSAQTKQTKLQENQISFKCIFGAKDWFIANSFSDGGEVKWSFDGTNVYYSLRITNSSSRSLEIANKVEEKYKIGVGTYNPSNLTIRVFPSANGVPMGDVAVNIPWLAFCSGNYLKLDQRTVPLPVCNARLEALTLGYRDETETFSEYPNLPKKIDLFTDRSSALRALKSFYPSRPERWVLGNIPEGSLKFHYAVDETTNFLGRTIPVHFEYFQNTFDENGNAVPIYGGICSITYLSTCGKPESLFNAYLSQTVVDYRLADPTGGIKSVTYRLTNSSLEDVNSESLRRAFEVQRSKLSGSRKSTLNSSWRSRIIIVCMFATALIPVVIVKTQRKHNQNSTNV